MPRLVGTAAQRWQRLQERGYRALGRSSLAVGAALRIRNVSQALIAHRLNEGIEFNENGERWLAAAAARGAKVLVDVGAHDGSWAAMVLDLMPSPRTAILFEPGPIAHARAAERFRGVEGVEVVQAAVGDRPGRLPFHEAPGGDQHSSLVDPVDRHGLRRVDVDVATLDEALGRRKIEYVDFCKVDAEGYDLRVLRGAEGLLTDRRIGLLQFEYNSNWASAGSTLHEAFEIFRGHDYDVHLLKSDGLYDLDYDRYGEFFSYANFVAVSPQRRPELARRTRGTI
jgi:FkbM family methyltransferase